MFSLRSGWAFTQNGTSWKSYCPWCDTRWKLLYCCYIRENTHLAGIIIYRTGSQFLKPWLDKSFCCTTDHKHLWGNISYLILPDISLNMALSVWSWASPLPWFEHEFPWISIVKGISKLPTAGCLSAFLAYPSLCLKYQLIIIIQYCQASVCSGRYIPIMIVSCWNEWDHSVTHPIAVIVDSGDENKSQCNFIQVDTFQTIN